MMSLHPCSHLVLFFPKMNGKTNPILRHAFWGWVFISIRKRKRKYPFPLFFAGEITKRSSSIKCPVLNCIRKSQIFKEKDNLSDLTVTWLSCFRSEFYKLHHFFESDTVLVSWVPSLFWDDQSFWMPRKRKKKAGGYNKPEELDCEESGLCINQMKPLASKLFVSVNEIPIQDPINVAHKCLIHKEENKFDLNWEGILLPSTAISRYSQINSLPSLDFHKLPMQFIKHF